ncbi:hypothetical protein B0H12DRAFT_361522 [Mycena haematopus]|nr:hypothetical protein B0H12DRAFT_361522 [Mycena haematopus]
MINVCVAPYIGGSTDIDGSRLRAVPYRVKRPCLRLCSIRQKEDLTRLRQLSSKRQPTSMELGCFSYYGPHGLSSVSHRDRSDHWICHGRRQLQSTFSSPPVVEQTHRTPIPRKVMNNQKHTISSASASTAWTNLPNVTGAQVFENTGWTLLKRISQAAEGEKAEKAAKEAVAAVLARDPRLRHTTFSASERSW